MLMYQRNRGMGNIEAWAGPNWKALIRDENMLK